MLPVCLGCGSNSRVCGSPATVGQERSARQWCPWIRHSWKHSSEPGPVLGLLVLLVLPAMIGVVRDRRIDRQLGRRRPEQASPTHRGLTAPGAVTADDDPVTAGRDLDRGQKSSSKPTVPSTATWYADGRRSKKLVSSWTPCSSMKENGFSRAVDRREARGAPGAGRRRTPGTARIDSVFMPGRPSPHRSRAELQLRLDGLPHHVGDLLLELRRRRAPAPPCGRCPPPRRRSSCASSRRGTPSWCRWPGRAADPGCGTSRRTRRRRRRTGPRCTRRSRSG